MSRAIRNGGWTVLLLSTMCAATVHAQRGLRGPGGPPPAPQAQAPPPQAPAAQAPAVQPAAAPQSAPAQSTEVAPSMLQQPARDAQIVFADGNLSIHADNSSLAAILRQVASNSGMKIEGLGADERVFGNFGPGAPRDVLADLLVGTAYNQVLLGDLSNGAPRELILSPATRGGVSTPSQAVQANANADDGNDADAADNAPPPPPPPPQQEQPAGSPQQQPPGVRTPQQLFEQLQQMRAAQQRGQQQQQQQQPVQQDSPMQ